TTTGNSYCTYCTYSLWTAVGRVSIPRPVGSRSRWGRSCGSGQGGDGHPRRGRRSVHRGQRPGQFLHGDHAADGATEVEAAAGDLAEQVAVLADGQSVAAEDPQLLADDLPHRQRRIGVGPQQQADLDMAAPG